MKKLFLAMMLFILASVAIADESLVPVKHRRGAEQTFLTFPEWYLVHSPAEYARFVENHPAHEFPFLRHIGQMWSSYKQVAQEQVRKGYPINIGYHVMICVITGSTAIEYGLRSAYENTLGRLSWALSSRHLTEEDRYGTRVAQEYVDFIRQQPWYLFDFNEKLKGLWSTVPITGQGQVRKLERRYALTTEYIIKSVYGRLIKFSTRQAYSPAEMATYVVLDQMPNALPIELNIKLLKKYPDGKVLVSLPRYFNFRVAATRLAENGSRFLDIAGNQNVIVVSVWAEEEANSQSLKARTLFVQPLITHPGMQRLVLVVPVRGLSEFLLHAKKKGIAVEHVYDY